jgi:hypothetical protein
MDHRTSYPYSAGMDIGIGDRGHAFTLWGLDGVYSPAWAAGIWYHDVFEYDPTTQVLSLTITNLSTGTQFMQLTRNVASFPTDMTRLGVSRLHMKGSPPGANPNDSVDYRLDNVSLWELPPKASIRFSQVEICWPSRTNVIYNVQCASSLSRNVWVDLFTNIVGAAGQTCVQDAIPVGQPQKFYRVQVVN